MAKIEMFKGAATLYHGESVGVYFDRVALPDDEVEVSDRRARRVLAQRVCAMRRNGWSPYDTSDLSEVVLVKGADCCKMRIVR